jgi:hypothetical protein
MAVDKPDTTRVWASAAPPTDIEDPDISSPGKVEDGYRDEIPVYQHHNWIFNEASKSAKYLNEQGIGIWDSITTFPVGSIVKGSDLNLYQAIVEQSNNDPVGDKTNWKPFVTSTTVGGRKNLLENAEFRIWQEGNSFSIASTEAKYTADRFIVYSLNGTTQANRVSASKFPSYSNDIAGGLQLLPQGGVSDFDASIRLDSVTSYVLAGKSATVSAIVNSNEAAVLKVQYLTPDVGDNWSTFTFRGEVSINLSVGDNKIEAVFNNMDSSVSRGVAIVFKFDSFTAGFFDAAIALPQLEIGTVSTTFEYTDFADDLARCQRYFISSYPIGFFPGEQAVNEGPYCVPDSDFNTFFMCNYVFPVAMRSRFPTISIYDQTTGELNKISDILENNQRTVVEIEYNQNGIFLIGVDIAVQPGRLYEFQCTADARL